MPEISYEPLAAAHLDAAVAMVIAAYQRERQSVPCLPEDNFAAGLTVAVRDLIDRGCGVAAFDGDSLTGFLGGYVVDGFFGRSTGVYCPLFGHGATNDRPHVYRDLYRQAAALWVEKSYFTHAVTVFAHDQDLVQTWFWQGFGLRCLDAIRQTSVIDNPGIDNLREDAALQVRESQPDDAASLAAIHAEHERYYRQPPLFMVRKDVDVTREHRDWLAKDGHHEWVAYRDGVPVGFMRLAPAAETFVADHPSVMNIKGTYVVDRERGTGVGTILLNRIQEWLLQNGYPLCGVDFESFNPPGSRFWLKHFTPYTYSLVRRIDERIRR